ncbi:AMP-binding protein [Halomicronema hongdechloris]|uniref:AMP-binding protein n=1 Tax=Halomicronema hongdechloris TaxID=1209493 RepID=UPI0019310D53
MVNGLRGLGTKRGDHVALFSPNVLEFVISYLGILKLGDVAVSLYVRYHRFPQRGYFFPWQCNF